MNIVDWYEKWKINRQLNRCKRGKHNWTNRPAGRIQCIDPGCGRYLQ